MKLSNRKFDLLEHLHIPLWLFKDISWLMIWKPLGMLMIIPTVSVAVVLVVYSLKTFQRLMLNLATLCWILANSNWMAGEFYEFDFRPVSFSLFISGIAFALVFLVFYIRNKEH